MCGKFIGACWRWLLELPEYRFEHLFIDNASKEDSRHLRAMAAEDPSVKVIVNARNVGADRSGMHAFLQAEGDAVGSVAADLQDPPELFAEMIRCGRKAFPSLPPSRTPARKAV